jgi:hypothetical protein
VTWLSDRPSAPGSVSRAPIAPTIVTARPSRIQTVPRPMMIIQCQRDQGSRSSRDGMRVLTMSPASALMTHAGLPA